MRLRHHLKHWLVPHRRNDHRPHLIRKHGLAMVVGVLMAVQGVAYVSAPVAARPAGGAGAS